VSVCVYTCIRQICIQRIRSSYQMGLQRLRESARQPCQVAGRPGRWCSRHSRRCQSTPVHRAGAALTAPPEYHPNMMRDTQLYVRDIQLYVFDLLPLWFASRLLCFMHSTLDPQRGEFSVKHKFLRYLCGKMVFLNSKFQIREFRAY